MMKTCKKCSVEFEVTESDLIFYKKISPTFNGIKFEIPAPTLCYECRLQRRLSWRNERNLFARNSSKSNKPIVSAYPADSEYTIFSQDEWWSDDWDASRFALDYDENQSFFKQFSNFQKKIPRITLVNSKAENSEYLNQAHSNKDSYMCFDLGWCENALYSKTCYSSNNITDCFNCRDNCSYIYECIDCKNSTNSTNCTNCHDVSSCHFCYRIKSCQDCILCSNMQHKQYCIENKQYTKEEYENKKKDLNLDSHLGREDLKNKFEQLKKDSVHKYANLFKCEDCSGNNLSECKKLETSFGANKSEDGKYVFYSERIKDSYDDNFSGGESNSEMDLETIGCYVPYNCQFVSSSWSVQNLLYCDFCHNCKDCFGCVGLKQKQYCILNKQYTKEEYEKLAATIITKMQQDGEWGEFFPIELSPYTYNMSLAGDYFPLSKSEIESHGYRYHEKVETLIPTPDFIIPDKITDTDQSILEKVLSCEASHRPFKIQPQELAFYIKMNLPIPHKHPDQRYKERFNSLNPLKLWHRKCMNKNCQNEFETTYAPDRSERVFCEECYQKEVV